MVPNVDKANKRDEFFFVVQNIFAGHAETKSDFTPTKTMFVWNEV
jgi:hypothetical protein